MKITKTKFTALAKDHNALIKANICEYQGQYNKNINVKYNKTLFYTILQQRQLKSY